MGMQQEALQELQQLFGQRVTTDALERRIYSYGVGTMPGLVRPLIGRALTDAVVQPRSEEEVVRPVRWAGEHAVPLVPRARPPRATAAWSRCGAAWWPT